ncbi:NUDIX hydrolase [Periweissella beninensis]|uniref:NUDIX hydrolase n=1 Tax=Periweissella beninensis TaxID=504936 RepID=A0ABT0VG57_9LACO|nr:NUDIX hydrolase [Periweissella beninensis]MBM7543800.1 ADP-ribose pyrophosphatase [Periweissella beninensis]MCM2436817.1 NUDIX hydrolase [Periweissella beninensis]MCT4395476.1 NUDIX hydrolase [Periweissella beninensis]
MDFTEKVIKKDVKYQGGIIDVEEQIVELPNGKLAKRDVVHHAPAIGILAITSANEAILIEQWRTAPAKTTLEIPAGKVDERDTSPLDTVIRELNEETRLQARHIERISSFYLSTGFSDELMHLYLATGLTPVTNELPQDIDENLTYQTYTLAQLDALQAHGQLDDSKTQVAYWYWKNKVAYVKELVNG